MRRYVTASLSFQSYAKCRTGICAGKSSIASFLVKEHGFKRLHLDRTASTPSVEKSASNTTVPHEIDEGPGSVLSFRTADALLDYVTARWQEYWVTTDIWDESVLDVLLRRPFFLLLSVDAPVTVRWDRFEARSDISHKRNGTLTSNTTADA
jgi:dCMP deaminase